MPGPEYERFLVFEIINYYPTGGLGDVVKSFSTLSHAKEYTKGKVGKFKEVVRLSDWEIFDCTKRKIVWVN